MKERIALVLSGGASKGSFQAGALKYLSEQGVDPDIFTGVSVGALNASLAAEWGLDDLWSFWRDITFSKVYTKYNIFRTVWRVWTKGGLMSSDPLRRVIDNVIHPERVIARGKVLRVGVTNLDDGVYEVFGPDSKHFKRALLASTTIPLTVPPVVIDGKRYVDGGVRNITPIGDALAFHPDRMIIISTSPRMQKGEPPKRILGSWGIGFIKHAVDTVVDEGFESDFREFERINNILEIPGNTHPKYRYVPVTVIYPEEDLGPGSVFEPALHKKRFDLGYEAAQKAFEGQ